ncbi:MAG: hypothetical protein DRH90_20760 [Deltaproteobacteria bacterium]|nr:MAG: hypothetical protein DRH90_20760 [Deltaproteobacteria bacterium]
MKVTRVISVPWSFMLLLSIKGMQAFKDNPGADPIKGWEYYDLKEGYRVRILLNKDLEIVKTSKQSEFAFD